MQFSTVPRSLVHRGLRPPLEVAESVARAVGVEVDEGWSPSMAFEGFEAETKRLLGTLLRDGKLVDEGLRQRAWRDELRTSLRLSSSAQAKRPQGLAKTRQRVVDLETQPEALADTQKKVRGLRKNTC